MDKKYEARSVEKHTESLPELRIPECPQVKEEGLVRPSPFLLPFPTPFSLQPLRLPLLPLLSSIRVVCAPILGPDYPANPTRDGQPLAKSGP
jgi:hypothetical protein